MNAMEKMADLAKEHHDRQSCRIWRIWRYFANFVTAIHLLKFTPMGGWRFGGVYMPLEVQLQEVAPSQARDRKGVGVGIYRKAEWTVGRQIWFCCRVARPRAIIPFWTKTSVVEPTSYYTSIEGSDSNPIFFSRSSCFIFGSAVWVCHTRIYIEFLK